MPVERNMSSPSSNAKSRRDGNAAAWSVAATKKRPKPSRLAVTCRCSLAQSSLEMLYLLQNACVASVSRGNQPSCNRCVVPSPSPIGMVSSALQMLMHARATSRSAERLARSHRWKNLLEEEFQEPSRIDGVVCGRFSQLRQLAVSNTLANKAAKKSSAFGRYACKVLLHTFFETSDWVCCRPSVTQPTRGHETAWESPLPNFAKQKHDGFLRRPARPAAAALAGRRGAGPAAALLF